MCCRGGEHSLNGAHTCASQPGRCALAQADMTDQPLPRQALHRTMLTPPAACVFLCWRLHEPRAMEETDAYCTPGETARA